MCNSISNKKYINESIINSFIIGFDSEVTSTYMYTNLFSKKKKKKIHKPQYSFYNITIWSFYESI